MKNPVGRPTKYDRDFHPEDFIAEMAQGKNLVEVAQKWNVDTTTVYEWARKHREFSLALKKGREYCEAWYSRLGRAAMVGEAKINGKPIKVDLGMFVWMTKNICKWTDKTDTKIHAAQETKGQIVVQLPPKKSKAK